MHSLRKNENISMWGKRIAPQQKKLLPFLPGSLLNSLITQFFAWSTRVCTLHLVLCQVQGEDSDIQDLKEWCESENGLDVSKCINYWWTEYSAFYKLWWYICQKRISFVEFVTVMTLNASLI